MSWTRRACCPLQVTGAGLLATVHPDVLAWEGSFG
jgi:hypothetical protein